MVYALTEVKVSLKRSYPTLHSSAEGSTGVESVQDSGSHQLPMIPAAQDVTNNRKSSADVGSTKREEDGNAATVYQGSPENNEETKEETETGNNQDDADEESEEEIALASTPENERNLLYMGHAWDNTAKGGRIHLHPNAPDICFPGKNFGNKIQGIKSKRALKKGRHIWIIQELLFYQPRSSDDIEEVRNDLIVGIGTHTFARTRTAQRKEIAGSLKCSSPTLNNNDEFFVDCSQ